nr:uncharacterized protein LOC107279893 [Oryza sativa Japonica Group]
MASSGSPLKRMRRGGSRQRGRTGGCGGTRSLRGGERGREDAAGGGGVRAKRRRWRQATPHAAAAHLGAEPLQLEVPGSMLEHGADVAHREHDLGDLPPEQLPGAPRHLREHLITCSDRFTALAHVGVITTDPAPMAEKSMILSRRLGTLIAAAAEGRDGEGQRITACQCPRDRRFKQLGVFQ